MSEVPLYLAEVFPGEVPELELLVRLDPLLRRDHKPGPTRVSVQLPDATGHASVQTLDTKGGTLWRVSARAPPPTDSTHFFVAITNL